MREGSDGGGDKKKKDQKKKYRQIDINNRPPAMEDGWERSPPRGADWGWFGCQGVFLAFFFFLFFCHPSTWVVAIVKGESRRVGEGTGERGEGEGGGEGERGGQGW